jgi:hypothetical protein
VASCSNQEFSQAAKTFIVCSTDITDKNGIRQRTMRTHPNLPHPCNRYSPSEKSVPSVVIFSALLLVYSTTPLLLYRSSVLPFCCSTALPFFCSAVLLLCRSEKKEERSPRTDRSPGQTSSAATLALEASPATDSLSTPRDASAAATVLGAAGIKRGPIENERPLGRKRRLRSAILREIS